jgi:hypothetical protein
VSTPSLLPSRTQFHLYVLRRDDGLLFSRMIYNPGSVYVKPLWVQVEPGNPEPVCLFSSMDDAMNTVNELKSMAYTVSVVNVKELT